MIGWIRYYGNNSDYSLKTVITVSGNRNTGNVIGGSSAGGIVGHIYNAAVVTGKSIRLGFHRSSNFAARRSRQPAAGRQQHFAEENIEVTGNVSTTPLDGIYGQCTDQFAYINNAKFIVENNSITEG